MKNRVFNRLSHKHLRQTLRGNTTEPEQMLWRVLRGEQLGAKFRRQHGIGRYIVDFYCPEAKLVLELDGDSHASSEAIAQDAVRDAYLAALSLRVRRFTNEQVLQNCEGVREEIRRVVFESSFESSVEDQTPSQPPP